MRSIVATNQFKRDSKLAQRRGLDMGRLKEIILKLQADEPLAERHRDHPLTGNWNQYRECHIEHFY